MTQGPGIMGRITPKIDTLRTSLPPLPTGYNLQHCQKTKIRYPGLGASFLINSNSQMLCTSDTMKVSLLLYLEIVSSTGN